MPVPLNKIIDSKCKNTSTSKKIPIVNCRTIVNNSQTIVKMSILYLDSWLLTLTLDACDVSVNRYALNFLDSVTQL
jgi:hypothetical protein